MVKLKAKSVHELEIELHALSLRNPGKWVHGLVIFTDAYAMIDSKPPTFRDDWDLRYRDGIKREPTEKWQARHTEYTESMAFSGDR